MDTQVATRDKTYETLSGRKFKLSELPKEQSRTYEEIRAQFEICMRNTECRHTFEMARDDANWFLNLGRDKLDEIFGEIKSYTPQEKRDQSPLNQIHLDMTSRLIRASPYWNPTEE